MLLLATLAATAALASLGPGPADTARAGDRVGACAAARELSPTVTADLRAALDAHGGVVRWDPARGQIRLWVQRRPAFAADVTVTGAEWRRTIGAAAESWRGIVHGLAFAMEQDSARADVIVTWDRDLENVPAGSELAFGAAGRTTLVPADDGRALASHVRLAVFGPRAARYSVEDVRAVARHELGHALGLAHHAAPSSVMAPLVRAERLTDDDRETLRALYALPIGERCAPSPRTAS